MNTRQTIRKDGLPCSGGGQMLVFSLGLLFSGLAHGLGIPGTSGDCLNISQQQHPVTGCIVPGPLSGDVSVDKGSQPRTLLLAQAEDSPENTNTDAKAATTPATDELGKETQGVSGSMASDGSAGEPGVAPQPSTELFISEVETPESVGGVALPESERDLFSLGGSSQRNDDDFDARTFSLSYRNHRRDWFWPWQEAASRSPDWGLDLDRTWGEYGLTEFRSVHLQGTLGTYLPAGSYFQAQVGRHTLQTDLGDRTITSHRLSAIFGLGRDLGLQLDASRDFIYPEGAVPGGIDEQMAARDYTASMRWRPAYRLRLLAQGNYREYEDDNNSQQGNLSILYGVSPEWPWIWAGIGAQHLSYDQQVSSYWSPERFTAYGLRFDSSFPLSQKLTGTAAANLDAMDEDGSTGTGYYLQAGLQYRLRGQMYARLNLSGSKSIQRTTTWSSSSINFWLSSPLF